MPETRRSGLQQLIRDERNMGLAGSIQEARELAEAYRASIGTGDPDAVLAAISALAQSAANTRKRMRAAMAQRDRAEA